MFTVSCRDRWKKSDTDGCSAQRIVLVLKVLVKSVVLTSPLSPSRAHTYTRPAGNSGSRLREQSSTATTPNNYCPEMFLAFWSTKGARSSVLTTILTSLSFRRRFPDLVRLHGFIIKSLQREAVSHRISGACQTTRLLQSFFSLVVWFCPPLSWQ